MRRGLTQARRTQYTPVGTYVSMVIWRVHCSAGRIRRLLSVTDTTAWEPGRGVLLAALGYVALSIDGPGRAFYRTAGHEPGMDFVEEIMNVPAPYVSYLYHYAYAGMRALTLFEKLSGVLPEPVPH
jgi:hypothetical protein